MFVRDILLAVRQGNHKILVRDNGFHVLVSRTQRGRYLYEIRHDYPAFESPEIINNWIVAHNVRAVMDLNGAICFMEGYNTAFDMMN